MDDESRPKSIKKYSGLRRRRTAIVLLGIAAALAFDLWVSVYLANDTPNDGKLYEQMATNIVGHGVFSAESQAPFTPTMIRLPGYPLFLAAVYSVFGDGNNYAVRVIQGGIYTAASLIAALIAGNWAGGPKRRRRRASQWTFVLAAFCPFTAIFSATILTETLTMFLIAVMILAATYAFRASSGIRAAVWWVVTGLAAGIAVMQRPDSGLFALGIGVSLVISGIWFKPSESGRGKHLFTAFWKGAVFSAAFILILVPWTTRNERLFGVFQPLAPADAEMPGEFVPHGYFLWLRTWIDDSRYIGPMLWDLEDKPIDISHLPANAFSSADERSQVAALLEQYNHSDPDRSSADTKADDEPATDDGDDDNTGDADGTDNETAQADANETCDLKISPEVDDAFRQIAEQRIAVEPIRYYVGLPVKRAASMWFDTHSEYYPFGGEFFPAADLDNEKYQQLWLPLFGALDGLYTFLAFAGTVMLWKGRYKTARLWLVIAILLCLPRIAFFGTLENPEPRYLVELFIIASVLGGIALSRFQIRRRKNAIAVELIYL